MSASPRPEVIVCPNCGAPLELDAASRCRWCHVPVTVQPPGPQLADGGVAGTFHVVAVTPPGVPHNMEAALVSGLLRGPFQTHLVQLVAALAHVDWPVAGQDLPAVADSAGNLEDVLFAVPHNSAAKGLQADLRGWDDGPDGSNLRAMAEYLASAGIQPGDIGSLTWPALAAELARACARYCTVISGEQQAQLMHAGERAEGTVATAQRLPVQTVLPELQQRAPGMIVAWVTLEVTPRGQPYRTTIRQVFRSEEQFAAMTAAGTTWPLRTDPAESARVVLDVPALGNASAGRHS